MCMSFELKKNGKTIACLKKPHWWLTSFCMGLYSNPKDLSMDATITFPNHDMLHAFLKSLTKHPYAAQNIYTIGLTVSFPFETCPTCDYRFAKWLYMRFVQWKNFLLCKLFLTITKPFQTSCDRLLYLYYYAPFAFRNMFRLHSRQCKKVRKRKV